MITAGKDLSDLSNLSVRRAKGSVVTRHRSLRMRLLTTRRYELSWATYIHTRVGTAVPLIYSMSTCRPSPPNNRAMGIVRGIQREFRRTVFRVYMIYCVMLQPVSGGKQTATIQRSSRYQSFQLIEPLGLVGFSNFSPQVLCRLSIPKMTGTCESLNFGDWYFDLCINSSQRRNIAVHPQTTASAQSSDNLACLNTGGSRLPSVAYETLTLPSVQAVSYTHLTLPTIYSV